jgi:hypothetical protein
LKGDDVDCPICDEISWAGASRCGIIETSDLTYLEVAAQFDLQTDSPYYPTDALSARKVAIEILHRDLVYQLEIMPLARAEQLVDQFFMLFTDQIVQCYTNRISYDSGGMAWSSKTDATFDIGILVMGETFAGVLWVEGED